MEFTPDWVSAIGSLVVAGSAVFAAYQGAKSLKAWRVELIGSKKAELSEDVLSDFYQARDLIKAVHSPFSSPDHESARRERGEFETEDQARALNAHYVPIARIEKHSVFFSDLLAKRYRMKALFGDEVDLAFDHINQSLRKIQSAASMMMMVSRRPDGQTNRNLWEEWESLIWEDLEDDPIAPLVDEAIARIEGICGPVLEDRA
jgi:hypothetical protein